MAEYGKLHRDDSGYSANWTAVVHVYNDVRWSSSAIFEQHVHVHNRRLVLYMIYYPPHLKYQYGALGSTADEDVAYDTHDTRPLLSGTPKPTITKSSDWRLSIVLACVVAVHLSVCFCFIGFLG